MYTSESYTSFKNFLQNIDSIFEINDCYRTRGNESFTELSEIKNAKIKINNSNSKLSSRLQDIGQDLYIWWIFYFFSMVWCAHHGVHSLTTWQVFWLNLSAPKLVFQPQTPSSRYFLRFDYLIGFNLWEC